MQYRKALEAWGAKRLWEYHYSDGSRAVSVEEVQVSMRLEEHGDYDIRRHYWEDRDYHDCIVYASAFIEIIGKAVYVSGVRRMWSLNIDHKDFILDDFLREVCESADDGVISLS